VRLSWPVGSRESFALGLGATVVSEVTANHTTTTEAVDYPVGTQRFTAERSPTVQARLAASNATGLTFPSVRAGGSTTIAGQTNPRLRHARIAVGYLSADSPRQGAIGVAATDSQGRFRVVEVHSRRHVRDNCEHGQDPDRIPAGPLRPDPHRTQASR